MRRIYFLFIVIINFSIVYSKEATKNIFITKLKSAMETNNVEKFKELLSPKCKGDTIFSKIYTRKGNNIESVELLDANADQKLNNYQLPHAIENIIEVKLTKITSNKTTTQSKFKIPLVEYHGDYYIVVPTCYKKKEINMKEISGNKFIIRDDLNKRVRVDNYTIDLVRVDNKDNRIYLKSTPRNSKLVVEAYDKSGKKISDIGIGQNLSTPQISNHNFLYSVMPEYILIY